MMSTSTYESCKVAYSRKRNSATFTPPGATGTATTPHQTDLKSLASRVLQRNQGRNSTATTQKADRNFSVDTARPDATPVTEVVPDVCRECPRVEVLTLAGHPVPGCQYLAEGEFTDGWRRLPADTRRCIWGNPSTRWRDPAGPAGIDKEGQR